ncbi:MAG: hypothetical protein MUF15_06215, partial [Acidobacteria bacterium]|nr:hypothetical protein [Acidobacteriota bacterium]
MRKNTTLTIGITGCSFLLFFFTLCAHAGRISNSFINFNTTAAPGMSATGDIPVTRSYEIQFHIVNLHKKLDYNRLNAMGITKLIYRVFED